MELTDALLDLCSADIQPIIAIDGPAGAGKTTLATHINFALSSHFTCSIIHMDDLYAGWENALSPELTTILEKICRSHKAQEGITFSKYDWATSNFLAPEKIAPVQLLIIEGVGSGQSAIRDFLSTLIWINIDEISGFTRVLERDGDAIKDQMQKWLATQEQHFASEKTDNAADFVLTT
jgi:uridine kinase